MKNIDLTEENMPTHRSGNLDSEEIISLPLHLNMNKADIDRVVSVIQRFFK